MPKGQPEVVNGRRTYLSMAKGNIHEENH